MIQLRCLSGSMAGTDTVVRHFPFSVGRAGNADLTLVEPGVWDQHATLQFEQGDGFYIETEGDALMTVNGVAARRTRLRNGDRIELGGAVLRMWLGAARQKNLRLFELLVWLMGGLLVAAQVWLIANLG